MSPDTLLYNIADALSMELHLMDEDGKNRIRGTKERKFRAGPWEFKTDMAVCSDVLETNRCSFLVRYTAAIWAYVVCTHASDGEGNLTGQTPLHIIIFDGEELGLKVKDMKAFGTGDIIKTTEKIGTAFRAAYLYDEQEKQWKEEVVSG